MQLMENKDIKFISCWGENKTGMCCTTHYGVIIYRVTIYPQLCENQVTSFQVVSSFTPLVNVAAIKKGLIYKVGAFIAEDSKRH